MNRPIRHVIAVLLGLFTILFVQLNRIQVFQAGDLRVNDANTRTIQRDFNKERGRIYTADGVLIADSTPTPDSVYDFQRAYPEGKLYAHITGYLSPIFGAEGVELIYNDYLIGESDAQQVRGLANPLDGRNPIGDLHLSIDHGLQSVARDALGQRRGAVVVLNPATGAVQAMWSYPSYDPNLMASLDGHLANEAWTELVEAEGNPLLSKAYQDHFAPGSTFKVITSSAALESGWVALDQPSFAALAEYQAPLTSHSIRNYGDSTCGGPLIELLRVSCNTGFAQMASTLIGPEGMSQSAQNFGFNAVPPIDLPNPIASRFPTDYGARVQSPTDEIPAGVYEDTPLLAQASIGQYDVAATPLQMALVAAGIANGGEIQSPYVVQEVRDRENERSIQPQVGGRWRTATSSDQATQLTLAMIGVVESGTAKSVARPGLIVGAKTGTAQVGTDPPRSHAWMIAFAGRAEQPADLAIAVLVEGVEGSADQTGGGTAGPIVGSLIDHYYQP